MKNYIIFLFPYGPTLKIMASAKKRGFYNIALMMNDGFPEDSPYGSYRELIDLVVPVSTHDSYTEIIFKIKDAVDDNCINGSYSSGDPELLLNIAIQESFNLPGMSKSLATMLLDKFSVRQKLKQANLSQLNSLSAAEAIKLNDWPFQNAAYFKPSHGTWSLFVNRCKNFSDFQDAMKRWQDAELDDIVKNIPFLENHLFAHDKFDFYLEEEIQGELISVEAMSYDGVFYPLGILSRILFSENPVVELGSCFPYPHRYDKEIIEYVRKSHETLGINNGATHTELIITPQGRMEIIDLNPRFVGADVLMSINVAYDTQIEEKILDMTLGLNPSIDLQEFADHVVCLQYIMPPEELKIFDSMCLPQEKDVVFKQIYAKQGQIFNTTNTQPDILGGYLVKGRHFKEVYQRAVMLREDVVVNGKMKARF